jgi:hypothetical protein
MRFLFAVAVVFTFSINTIAQNTQEEGTVFISGGIGKSWAFSPTFNLNQSVKTKSSLVDNFSAPQWSAKAGYVFANHFAVDINAERFLWTYNSPSFLFLNDVLYTRLGIFGMDKWYKTNKSEFAITWLTGLSLGPIFSNNALSNNSLHFKSNSLNGVGYTFNLGLRFEFYKRFYLLVEQTGGLITQKLKTDISTISLNQPYMRTNLSLGVFIYERWNESCNTCPKW